MGVIAFAAPIADAANNSMIPMIAGLTAMGAFNAYSLNNQIESHEKTEPLASFSFAPDESSAKAGFGIVSKNRYYVSGAPTHINNYFICNVDDAIFNKMYQRTNKDGSHTIMCGLKAHGQQKYVEAKSLPEFIKQEAGRNVYVDQVTFTKGEELLYHFSTRP
ncbi:hypothetical protein LMG33810_002711 [Carnimonas sp. LMG 33810]